MSTGQTVSQIVYDGATEGGGKDPTTSYTATSGTNIQWDCRAFNTLSLQFDLVSGTAPTSLEFLLEHANSDINTAGGSSRWFNKGAQIVAAGSITQQETIRQITWSLSASSANGHHWDESINAEKFRVRVKRTGGAADTRIVVRAYLGVK